MVTDDFAYPNVPAELRPLFLRVLDEVTAAMREPGRAASVPEAMLRNGIRRAFEDCGAELQARIAKIEAELESACDELAFVAARATEH